MSIRRIATNADALTNIRRCHSARRRMPCPPPDRSIGRLNTRSCRKRTRSRSGTASSRRRNSFSSAILTASVLFTVPAGRQLLGELIDGFVANIQGHWRLRIDAMPLMSTREGEQYNGLRSGQQQAMTFAMFCGLRLACRTARAVARGGACLLALGLLLRLSRP